MFGSQLSKNINKVIGSDVYTCDTFIAQSELHFILRRLIKSTLPDPFLSKICSDPLKLAILINNLAIETVPEYISRSITFKFINNRLEGTLAMNDHIEHALMFTYDEAVIINEY